MKNTSRPAVKLFSNQKLRPKSNLLPSNTYLREKQKQHSKINEILYTKLETQEYMKSPLFNDEEVNTLHALRCRAVNVKANLKNKYGGDLLCLKNEDNQIHILECPELTKRLKNSEIYNNKCTYQDLFANHKLQKPITHLFVMLINIRNNLLDKNLCKIADPSTSSQVLVDSDDLLPSIVHYSLGK